MSTIILNTKQNSNLKMVQEVNESDFKKEVLNADKPVIVDSWAEWCGPCKMISPIFEELSKELTNIKFVKLNVDDNQEIASEYNIMGIPTLMVFKNGKELGRIVGAIPKEQLKSKIQSFL